MTWIGTPESAPGDTIVDDTPAAARECARARRHARRALVEGDARRARRRRQPRPKKAPAELARLAVGGRDRAFMNEPRGADDARAALTLSRTATTPGGATGSWRS
ncbi:hypothetical protein [Streptomyces sp. NBC_00076]|uniref:hypothetical protein n=1 Tax=Streptomyces sp. NBC_00076 TaxID=2975642 RepID=UPI0032499ABF